jgi:hypothetical protein
MRKNRQNQIETQGELVSYNEGQGTRNRTDFTASAHPVGKASE